MHTLVRFLFTTTHGITPHKGTIADILSVCTAPLGNTHREEYNVYMSTGSL